MIVKVFVQNEAGSNRRHIYDEKNLTLLRVADLPEPYPYPYGFILDTTGADGDNVDCYVITHKPLHTGQVVQCQVLGLMEQLEGAEEVDHKILARLVEDEAITIAPEVRDAIAGFIGRIFAASHVPVQIGAVLGADQAEAYIAACRADERG